MNHNTYNPKIVDEQILLLWTKGAAKYYRYKYLSQIDTLNHVIYWIKVTPKVESLQLVSDVFSVVDGQWTIYRYDINGKWEFSKFKISAAILQVLPILCLLSETKYFGKKPENLTCS